MPTTKDNQEFTKSLFLASSLLEDAIEWIRENMKPNQVFNDNQLEDWAEDNGYAKEASIK